MAMTRGTERLLRCALPVAALALTAVAPASARADFFDDTRQFFTTDFPHFFQDDIPCTFGGHPTSGTRASCDSPRHAPRHPAAKSTTAPPPARPEGESAAPSPDR